MIDSVAVPRWFNRDPVIVSMTGAERYVASTVCLFLAVREGSPEEWIRAGRLPPGVVSETEEQIAGHSGVSVKFVRAVLSRLERAGWASREEHEGQQIILVTVASTRHRSETHQRGS